jgi:septum formation protein
MKLVLRSASPRRRELLERVGVRFSVAPAHIDETQRPGEPALSYVLRMAQEKSGEARDGQVALGADTIVVKGEEVLGKPRDVADAERILAMLSGAEHRVITAVAVSGLPAVAVETRVRFAALSRAQIRWLASSGDGDDKAGAYAAQGLAGAFIERIEGSFSNVVGLPLLETLRLLDQAGVELPWR